jgi:hypothetical protein
VGRIRHLDVLSVRTYRRRAARAPIRRIRSPLRPRPSLSNNSSREDDEMVERDAYLDVLAGSDVS